MAVTVIKNVSRKVAAPKKSKIGLIIGISFIIIASGLGIYFWYKSKNPKTPTSETDTVIDTSTTLDKDKGNSPKIETTIKTDTNPVIVKNTKSENVTSGKGNTLDEIEANLKSKGFTSSQIQRYIKYVKVIYASFDGKVRYYATFYSNGHFVISKSIGTTITVLGTGMWSDSGNKIVLDKSGRILKEGIDKNVFSFT